MSNFRLIHRNGPKWDKIFKNGPSKICGRQPLKNLISDFLKAAFHKFTWSILKYFAPNISKNFDIL